MRTHLFVALVALGFGLLSSARGASVTWGSHPFLASQTSTGKALDGTFTFELGSFTPEFDPAATTDKTAWIANWHRADRAFYLPQNEWFRSQFDVSSNEGAFAMTNRAYIWGFNASDPGEWILIGDPSWTWPNGEDQNALPVDWSVQNATSIVLGSVNPNTAPHMTTALVSGSGSPVSSEVQWLLDNFTSEELNRSKRQRRLLWRCRWRWPHQRAGVCP